MMDWISALFGVGLFLTLIAVFVALAVALGLDEALRDRGDE